MNVKRGSTTFLKVIIFLIGIAVLAACIFLLPEAARRDAVERPGDYSLYPLFWYVHMEYVSHFLWRCIKLLNF